MEKLNPVKNNVLIMYCIEDEDGKLHTTHWGSPTMGIALRYKEVRNFLWKFLNIALKDPSRKSVEIDQSVKNNGFNCWVRPKEGVGTRYHIKGNIMPDLVSCLNKDEGLELVIIIPDLKYLYDELIITSETSNSYKDGFHIEQIKATHQTTFKDIPGLPNHKILYISLKQKVENLHVYSGLHRICSRKPFWDKLKFWK